MSRLAGVQFAHGERPRTVLSLLFRGGHVCAKNRLNVKRAPHPRLVCSRRITCRLTVLPRTLRVHALTGRITLETLYKAFKAVQRNRGAAGLDKQALTMFEANLDENLVALMRALKSGTSQPIPSGGCIFPKVQGSSGL